MDSIASAVDRLKGFAQDLFKGLDSSSRCNPIEILKRLQRESFSDLMKLRDRQDKVERLLSYYKTSKGNPFQEPSTHLRGEVDLLGAVLLMSEVDEEHWDGVGRAGIRTGVDSRFRFETRVRDKDSVGVEFAANKKGVTWNDGNLVGTPLSLSKLFYKANAGDWLSAIAVPFGAQFKDFDDDSDFSLKEQKGLTDLSLGPPLLHQNNGGAIGVTVRKSNIIASLAQSISGMSNEQTLSTFGQAVFRLPMRMKLSLLSIKRWPKLANRNVRLGALALPIGFSRHLEGAETAVEALTPQLRTSTLETGSIALKLETELDEYNRLAGWIEMKQANPEHFQWAVNLFDNSEDAFGWGLSLGGIVEGPRNWDQFQVESYLKFNLGRRLSLKPGIAYVVDGNSTTLALLFRSHWSL